MSCNQDANIRAALVEVEASLRDFMEWQARAPRARLGTNRIKELQALAAAALATKGDRHCTCDAPEGCVWYEHTADCDMYEQPDP